MIITQTLDIPADRRLIGRL